MAAGFGHTLGAKKEVPEDGMPLVAGVVLKVLKVFCISGSQPCLQFVPPGLGMQEREGQDQA